MNISRDDLKEELKKHQLAVTFTKKDGTARTILCTLRDSVLQSLPVQEKKTDRVKQDNPDVLAVYDLENQAWRSFRMDSITSVERYLNNENENV